MNKPIEQQYNFHKYLNIIRIGNKNDIQKRTLSNINIFYNAKKKCNPIYLRLWFNDS